MTVKVKRVISITLGTIGILGISVYVPAMLLAPLPPVTLQVNPADNASSAAGHPDLVLPGTGANAMNLLERTATTPIATSGDQKPVVIGGAAKFVTALVVLETKPLDGTPRLLTSSADDHNSYLQYQAAGARVLPVSLGETWSEQDALTALLLGSSNNHADALARWAFGSVETYVAKANEWLAAHQFNLRVDDATGLSPKNTGTAWEVTQLAGRLLANPSVAAMYAPTGRQVAGARAIPDVIAHLADAGVRTLARSFTDQGGLGLVFTYPIPATAAAPARTFIGTMLMMPDYATLDAAVLALVGSIPAASQPAQVIRQGEVYGTVTSVWGQHATLVAQATQTSSQWGLTAHTRSITLDTFSTAETGKVVGKITVKTDTDVSSALGLGSAITDPGPLWRLTHPVELFTLMIRHVIG